MKFKNNEKGASAIIVVIVIALLLAFSALAIDVGYMYATRNELQNIADSAALAGARELGKIYSDMPYAQQQTYNASTQDGDSNSVIDLLQIRAKVREAALVNKAANKNITISDSDIFVGIWDFKQPPDQILANSYTRPTAVRVIARRDSTLNTAVSTFFGRIFSFFGGSVDTFSVTAVATAALSGPSTVAEGVLKAPFAISEKIVNNCPELVAFSPTPSSCAGWHNFFDPMNADKAAEKAISLIEGFEGDSGTEGQDWLKTHFTIKKDPVAESTPEAEVGDSFNFQGGVIGKLFTSGGYYKDWTDKDTPINPDGNLEKPIPFINLFDFYRFRDGDGDGSKGDTVDACSYGTLNADKVWSTTVPVYKDDGETCTNPKGAIQIVGFANIVIVMPNPPPDDNIDVCLQCYTIIEPGRGGGGSLGNVLGDIPNLVQ